MLSATPSASQMVQNLVQEVLTWQKRNETQHLPKRYGVDDEQRKLGIRFAKLLLRRDKGLGTHPREAQLSPAEVALVNSVPGVPLRGCSMQATPSNAYSGFEEPGANTAHVATDIVSSGGDSGVEQPAAGAEAVMHSSSVQGDSCPGAQVDQSAGLPHLLGGHLVLKR